MRLHLAAALEQAAPQTSSSLPRGKAAVHVGALGSRGLLCSHARWQSRLTVLHIDDTLSRVAHGSPGGCHSTARPPHPVTGHFAPVPSQPEPEPPEVTSFTSCPSGS